MLGRQLHSARFSAMLVMSLALAFTVGCSRDPNVRKQKFLDSGKKFETAGKYKEAAIQFSNALKLDRNFAPAYFEIAKTDLKLNFPAPAYGALLKTVELDPKNLEARITLGNMLLAGGAKDRAETQARQILAINPNYADGYALLAGTAARNHNPADARTNIEKAISLDPNKAIYHSALAILIAANPADEGTAEQELRKAASLDSKSAQPHLLLSQLLEKKGDIQGANQELHTAIAAAPTDLKSREALASLYLHAGDKANAEQTLVQAVKDMPDNEAAADVLASYFGSTSQLDRAETVFADLYSNYPKNFAIKLVYARILYDRKEYDKATPIVDKLIKIDAGNSQVQILDAMLLVQTGKADEALALMKKSAKDNPNDVKVQLLLATTALQKNDMQTAETAWHQVQKVEPGNIEAANGLAQIAMSRNDSATLIDIAERTLKAQPNYLAPYLWRGMAEVKNKQYGVAEADYQKVIQTSPQNSLAYLQLAELRIAQGRVPEAKTLLQTSLDKDPNATRALGLLVAYDLQAKQPDKALARVQAQIAKVPEQQQPSTLSLLSIQLNNQDSKGALDSSQKAMQLAPKSEEAFGVYTQALVAIGNLDAALSKWQEWLNTHPNDISATNILGSLEEAKGDQPKAMEYYKKALTLDATNVVAANNLAYLMVENNQNVDVALSLAQTARRGKPDSTQTADTLAWVYYAKGNYLSA